MKLIYIFLIIVAAMSGNPANADVTLSRVDEVNRPTNPHLVIRGQIEKGDYEKFLEGIRQTYIYGDLGQLYVQLDSPGGDVLESMRIGRLVRKLKLTATSLFGQCDSACVFILVAGAKRIAPSGIGVHRPFFEKAYFSGLSADEAEEKYAKLMKESNDYLSEMGVAKEFIERMFRIPSNELEKLSLEDVHRWISGTQAALDEWLIAKCGSYTKEEDDDYSMWLAQMVQLKEGYVNYLKEKIETVDSCRMKTLANDRNRVAALLFPQLDKNKTPNK